MMKRSLFTLLAAAAISVPAVVAPALYTPAAAELNVNIDIGIPPPPARYEVVPAPREGFIWAPGFWRWEHERHVWAPGRWMEARRGEHWVPDRWAAHHDGGNDQWRHEAGHWEHDGHFHR